MRFVLSFYRSQMDEYELRYDHFCWPQILALLHQIYIFYIFFTHLVWKGGSVDSQGGLYYISQYHIYFDKLFYFCYKSKDSGKPGAHGAAVLKHVGKDGSPGPENVIL